MSFISSLGEGSTQLQSTCLITSQKQELIGVAVRCQALAGKLKERLDLRNQEMNGKKQEIERQKEYRKSLQLEADELEGLLKILKEMFEIDARDSGGVLTPENQELKKKITDCEQTIEAFSRKIVEFDNREASLLLELIPWKMEKEEMTELLDNSARLAERFMHTPTKESSVFYGYPAIYMDKICEHLQAVSEPQDDYLTPKTE